jgi:prepilin-type processing-associated H-X9-DG protein
MIAAAISFNSGILFVADAEPAGASSPGSMRASRKIFHKQYGVAPRCARSVFVVSELIDWALPAFQLCELALETLPPADATIDRMRDTIEHGLFETYHGQVELAPSERELASFVAVYSPAEQRYTLFQTTNTALREVNGYDCLGPAAYLGHYLIRDRYNAARSTDGLDLASVFSIAIDTLEGIRACNEECGKSSEMAVLYADGHVSEIQRIPQDTRKRRDVALAGLAHT